MSFYPDLSRLIFYPDLSRLIFYPDLSRQIKNLLFYENTFILSDNSSIALLLVNVEKQLFKNVISSLKETRSDRFKFSQLLNMLIINY